MRWPTSSARNSMLKAVERDQVKVIVMGGNGATSPAITVPAQ